MSCCTEKQFKFLNGWYILIYADRATWCTDSIETYKKFPNELQCYFTGPLKLENLIKKTLEYPEFCAFIGVEL